MTLPDTGTPSATLPYAIGDVAMQGRFRGNVL
jgi:hypothetical protein